MTAPSHSKEAREARNAERRAERAQTVTPPMRRALAKLTQRQGKVPGALGRSLVARGFVTESGGGWLRLTDSARAAISSTAPAVPT